MSGARLPDGPASSTPRAARRRPAKKATPRQREVLRWVARFIELHEYSPTWREIGKAMEIASTNGVHDHLVCLAKKGLVTWGDRGAQHVRALVITPAGREELGLPPKGEEGAAHASSRGREEGEGREGEGERDALLEKALAEIEELRAAIRKHRDEKGHDRCWLDDEVLYQTLGEPVPDRPLPPTAEFLAGCARFEALRRKGGDYVTPPTPELEGLREVRQAAERYISRCALGNQLPAWPGKEEEKAHEDRVDDAFLILASVLARCPS